MNAESVGVGRSGLFRQPISAEREQIFRGFRARVVVVKPSFHRERANSPVLERELD